MCLAFDQDTLAPTPTWTRLDDGVTRVASYTIDRGRQFELDQTDGGRAEVVINDVDGTLDPTNTGGTYYGFIEPLVQAAIARWNPVLEEWQTRFRGFVEDFNYVFDPSQRVNQLTMSLVDIFEILNAVEMLPGQFGDSPPPASDGQVFFDNANVDDRIIQVYGNAGIPDDFFVIFSGNVGLYETVYSPGETALAAIQEACDAEFPGVSNFYPDRFGRGVFHGRLAKFDPYGTWLSIGASDPIRDAVWSYRQWKAGDSTAVDLSPTDTAHIRTFTFNRGLASIRNQALATPLNIADADVAGQMYSDVSSIGHFGVRSWSAQNLLTKIGLLDASDALAETFQFATYIVDNYKQPRSRIDQIGFRPMAPGDARAAPNWKMLCQADIADSVEVTIDSPGGGGFVLEPCFIEGVHEEVSGRITMDGESFDNVTMTLDLSPRALFDANPFPTS